VARPVRGAVGVAPASQAPAVVHLNAADAAALDMLPGVGPATAARILAWRDEHGGFVSVDDLLEVPGIGPARLEALRSLVAVP
jgi:competence protein ComEA